MKTIWTIAIAGVSLAAALAMTACNNKGGGGGAPIAPSGPHQYSGSKVGFYAETKPLAQYFMSSGYYTNQYPVGVSTLSIGSGWRNILKEAMGVCDRLDISGGSASCSAWVNGFNDIVVFFDGNNPNKPQLILRSMLPQSGNQYYDYYYSLPDFEGLIASFFGIPVGNPAGVFDPMILEANIWPINNSQGFEVRAIGPNLSKAYNKRINLKVSNGKIEDPQFNFVVTYSDVNGNNEINAASGTMIRCQTQSCGL